MNPMAFNPTDGLRNPTSYPTNPGSEANARAQIQDPSDQLRDYINNTLIPEMNAPTTSAAAYAQYNKLINGNFDVWQRGTSFSGLNKYTADRWMIRGDGTGEVSTISQQAFTPGQGVVPNEPKYWWRKQVTTAPTGQTYHQLAQRIESVRSFAGQKVTLSFWAKADAARTITAGVLQQVFGTGGAPSATITSGGQSCSLSTSWQKFSVTTTLPSISGKTLGTNNDDYLELDFVLPNNSTFTIDIAQVQINAGDQALPFQPRSFAEELTMSQRYYEKSYKIGDAPGTPTTGGAIQGVTEDGTNTGACYGTVYFKVRKRVAPTVTVYGTGGTINTANDETADRSLGAGQFASGDETGFRMNFTLSSPSSKRRLLHYIADAEL